MPIPEVNRIVNAFVLGVKETNPKATVKVSFINSFFDPADRQAGRPGAASPREPTSCSPSATA